MSIGSGSDRDAIGADAPRAATCSPRKPRKRKEPAFRARARAHQSAFLQTQLGLPCRSGHSARLTTEDSLAGLNFYTQWDGLLKLVQDRYPRLDTPLYHDMLRSQHVPFNFFGPLALYLQSDLTWSLLKWLAPDLETVAAIHFEYAPAEARAVLQDNTAFDVFVEYRTANDLPCALGIEVKYTEGPYRYGKRERRQMWRPDSPYCQITNARRLYVDEAISVLRTRPLKQLWRNHLLGLPLDLQRFRSVLLYPSGNRHAAQAARAYRELLLPEHRHEFISVTFEEWLASASCVASSRKEHAWLDYLAARYDIARIQAPLRIPEVIVPVKLCVPPDRAADYPACSAAARLDWKAMPDHTSMEDMVHLAYAMEDGYKIAAVLGFSDDGVGRHREYEEAGHFLGLASELWCCLFVQARALSWTDYPGRTEDEYKPLWDDLYRALVERLRAEDGSVQRLGGGRMRWLGYGGLIQTRAERERAGLLNRTFLGP